MKKNAEHRGTLKNWEQMWSLSKDKWFRHPAFQEKIAGILKKWFAGRTILDIGCGTGDYLNKLRESCIPIGVDISLEALRLAQGHRVLASAESLPFKTGSAGGIFSIGTFHCLEHPEDMLKEVRRTLANDGLLILVMPSGRSLPAFFNRYFHAFLRRIFRRLERDEIPDIHRLFTIEALIELLVQNGYCAISHEMVHIGYAFKSPLIRLPLILIEKLRLHRMAEEIVVVCTPTPQR
jgi:SAM-dependent methyltransferase